MNQDTLINKLSQVNNDPVIQNLIAQANARYILFNTAEDREKYPPYTIQDESMDLLAFYYLHLGCNLAENQNLSGAMQPLERGASILENIHSAQLNKKTTSNYYGLVASLAYYVSFQYSKSFILIKKFEPTTVIARLVHHFLARDFQVLQDQINQIIVDQNYLDANIVNGEDGNLRIYESAIARALDGFIKYLHLGSEFFLVNSRIILKNLKEIAEIENDPGIWWVIRLLLLISDGFEESSLWNSLRPYFDLENEKVRSYISSLVYSSPRGVYELFITQRESLVKVLDPKNKGCIVSIPTSSGKTRIAEVAILNSLLTNPGGKVLYIAPFRSLAFEVENSLEKVFEHSGITVSQLYGGSMYSKLDEDAINDADIIIATPEKAKAIIRGNEEVVTYFKLAILDEGHLLGEDKRLVSNEIFYEELRHYMELNEGKFLLLSAVLPNAEDLAEWLTGSQDNVYKRNWRPSDERLGILEWRRGVVNLNWESLDRERSSYNTNFIVHTELPLIGRQRTLRYHPGNKNEAVAATAYKLRTFGPVLIFVGLTASVFTMAHAYEKALGDNPETHQWLKGFDWRTFEMSCIEAYGEEDNLWLHYARLGILCHNADLHSDVRLPLERLMRSAKPLVIISTYTLGQGGRAGRAFIDHEGKILIAVDTNCPMQRRKWLIGNAREYFNKSKINLAQSGILGCIMTLKAIAEDAGVGFELLLQLITENRLDEVGEDADVTEGVLDWIDDTLLALLLKHNPNGEIDVSLTDDFIRKSLAYLQGDKGDVLTGKQVHDFLTSRIHGIVEKVGEDRNKWRSIVKSGIPLASDLMLEELLPSLIELTLDYVRIELSIDEKIELLSGIETIIKHLPVLNEEGCYSDFDKISQIRNLWLKAIPISEIIKLENGTVVITSIYRFSLPWVLNGIAKKMRNLELEDEASLVEELSILVEAGLPSLLKVKVYQAGIRSRSAANEIGDVFGDELNDKSTRLIKQTLLEDKEFKKIIVSDATGEWIDVLSRNSLKVVKELRRINFTYGDVHNQTTKLIVQKILGVQYMMSPDLKYCMENDGELDFSAVCNIPGIEFNYDFLEDLWIMSSINPYVQIID